MRRNNLSSSSTRTTVITEDQDSGPSIAGQRSAPLIIRNDRSSPSSDEPPVNDSQVAQHIKQVEEIFDLETSVTLLNTELTSIRDDLLYVGAQEAELNELIEGLPEIEERDQRTYEANLILRESTRRMAQLWDSFSSAVVPTAVSLWSRVGEAVQERVTFCNADTRVASPNQSLTMLIRGEQNVNDEIQQNGIEVFFSPEAMSRSDRITELKKKIIELRNAIESESSVLDKRVRTFEINYSIYKKRLNSLCKDIDSVTKFIAAISEKLEAIIFHMLNAFKIKRTERIKNRENEAVRGIKNASI